MAYRDIIFTIRFSKAERAALDQLAATEEREPRDIIRRLITKTAEQRFGHQAQRPAQQERAA